MRGNFGLKLQNSPKLLRIHVQLDFIVMQIRKANREKGYSLLEDKKFLSLAFASIEYTCYIVQWNLDL